jgi:hypothetical protein
MWRFSSKFEEYCEKILPFYFYKNWYQDNIGNMCSNKHFQKLSLGFQFSEHPTTGSSP